MRKTHYIPITADVPGAANDANCALIRRTCLLYTSGIAGDRTAVEVDGII